MGTELNTFGALPPLERASALRLLLADHLGEDFAAFVKKAWRVLHPQRPLIWSWHYDYLCEVLTLVKLRLLLRVIINIPPRTLKSTLVTILFPANTSTSRIDKASREFLKPCEAWERGGTEQMS